MTAQGFTLFDTAIGRCALAWGERGVVGVQLPAASDAATRARMRARFPGAAEREAPRAVQRVLAAIAALLAGKARDLSAIGLDLADVPPFHRRVYELARTIPPGATLSYGELAEQLGSPGAARAVGQAMGKNPFPIIVPCHRVLAAGGKLGGFTATGGVNTKLKMLEIEGARIGTGTARARRGRNGARAAEAKRERNGARAAEATRERNGAGPAPATRERSGAARTATSHDGFDAARALRHLRDADSGLARLIDAVGPFRMQVRPAASLFVALAESIVYQQLTARAAGTIFGRVHALFPAPHGPTPERLLRLSDEKLRGAGLSRAKLLALRDLAERSAQGSLPTLAELEPWADEAIIECLSEVRGIGRWTAQMLLMFRLGRPDVFPLDDYGIRKGFALAFKKPELPSRAELERRSARWKPYRTAASWYLWRAVDLASEKKK